MDKNGSLYVVATPIGNLEDITLRAIKILKEVDLIAAEDTRHTLKLLNHLNISKPLISYHRHSEDSREETIIHKLENGESVALVSDAGTPGICDPGEILIKKCIEKQINVIPIPGACAFVNALIASGLDTKEFIFLGFLPMQKKLRKNKLEEIKKSQKTILLYEAPHKLKKTLIELKEIISDRKIVIARELTKIHEEFLRENINELINISDSLKGEFVIIIEGNKQDIEKNEIKTEEELYEFYLSQGFSKKEIIKKIAKDKNVTKNEIYIKFLNK